METITLEDVRRAAKWAKTAQQEADIDGQRRRYKQSDWDCGTSCCIWGAAALLSEAKKPISGPPSNEWAAQSQMHSLVNGLLCSGTTTPDQVLQLLSDANLRGANLSDADLSDANLSGADLSDANLSGADLSGADLRDADLRGADLRDADLRGANLRGANLRDADLSGADLRDADLSGADLRDADLSGADLSGAQVAIGNVSRTIA